MERNTRRALRIAQDLKLRYLFGQSPLAHRQEAGTAIDKCEEALRDLLQAQFLLILWVLSAMAFFPIVYFLAFQGVIETPLVYLLTLAVCIVLLAVALWILLRLYRGRRKNYAEAEATFRDCGFNLEMTELPQALPVVQQSVRARFSDFQGWLLLVRLLVATTEEERRLVAAKMHRHTPFEANRQLGEAITQYQSRLKALGEFHGGPFLLRFLGPLLTLPVALWHWLFGRTRRRGLEEEFKVARRNLLDRARGLKDSLVPPIMDVGSLIVAGVDVLDEVRYERFRQGEPLVRFLPTAVLNQVAATLLNKVRDVIALVRYPKGGPPHASGDMGAPTEPPPASGDKPKSPPAGDVVSVIAKSHSDVLDWVRGALMDVLDPHATSLDPTLRGRVRFDSFLVPETPASLSVAIMAMLDDPFDFLLADQKVPPEVVEPERRLFRETAEE
jgi:hypothetical protein